MKNDSEFELIFVIINSGYVDLVMSAAKGEGATGGTVLTGRGTGNEAMEKFFGIAIQPEKEIVLIIIPHDIKEKVLKAIYRDAGLETRGQGIAFALAVDDVVGIPRPVIEPPEENLPAEVIELKK
ncbi:MAG: P-II family nitrogen regulator [Firmicutes bacterium]|nr:P-II family nitrogen regulator [Bacillota bacterium]